MVRRSFDWNSASASSRLKRSLCATFSSIRSSAGSRAVMSRTHHSALVSRRPPDGERRVVPAEPEGVRERHVHVPLHGLVRRRVEVTGRVGGELVNGGGDDAGLDDEGADGGLEGGGRREQVV